MTTTQPTVTLTLTPGTYLVDVVTYPVPGARVWTHDRNGLIEGHGAKLRRAAVAYVFSELIVAAEKHEGRVP